MNAKWRFYKLNKLGVFAALLKDIPMECKDAVLPKISAWKSYNHLSLFQREHKTTI